MNAPLAGRVALVTGASRGIGRAIALALAEAGADVAVNYRREEAAAAEVVTAIEQRGRRSKAYCASVDDFDALAAMVDAVIADFGSIGILVNNAGIASRGNSVADTDPTELERVMRIHAFAPHHLCKLVIPHMRKEERGDIVMITSVATDVHAANGAPYTMGKAAAEALARTLAKEERPHGIRTNMVAPSLTVTEMAHRMMASRGIPDIHALDADAPFGRVAVPEDVAAAVVYLVSPANPYANGQRICLDGGG